MKLFKDFYVYPWRSSEANNCNTIFIDGEIPTIIDPGHIAFFSYIEDAMAQDGKDVGEAKLLIATHSHPDHVEAMDRFDEETLRAIGKREHDFLIESGQDIFILSGSAFPTKPFTLFLQEGALNIGSNRFEIIETPGHSPGSVCLYWEKEKLLISGDTLFYMGVGRTDLPGGNAQALAESLSRLAELDIEYLVPGHGEIVRGRKTIEKNFQIILGTYFQ